MPISTPRSLALATTALAKACSLLASSAASLPSSSSSSGSGSSAKISRTTGRPTVMVPVLSKKIRSVPAIRSIAPPPRTTIPAFAARVTAKEVARGVAIPMVQGQATTRTERALSRPWAAFPDTLQQRIDPAATINTAGINRAAARSAIRSAPEGLRQAS